MKQTIFCLEDDTDIRELLVYALTSSGFCAKGFENAKDFFAELKTTKPSLILLDIMLPDKDGMEVLHLLRENSETAHIPAIMLTAKSGQINKIRALDNGADDYVTKPFDIPELISRMKAVLRRSKPAENSGQTVLSYKEIQVNYSTRVATVNDSPLSLTYKEFELLYVLILNESIVLSREKLMTKVWGTDYLGETRTVDVHVRTLRHKLGDAGRYIETVRNVGYKIG